jgi:hypothetical protein
MEDDEFVEEKRSDDLVQCNFWRTPHAIRESHIPAFLVKKFLKLLESMGKRRF